MLETSARTPVNRCANIETPDPTARNAAKVKMSINKRNIGAPRLRLVAIGEKPQRKPEPAEFSGTSATIALIGAWRMVEAARADFQSGQSIWTPRELAFYIDRVESSIVDLRAALDYSQSEATK